jgi:hypothetical protein
MFKHLKITKIDFQKVQKSSGSASPPRPEIISHKLENNYHEKYEEVLKICILKLSFSIYT